MTTRQAKTAQQRIDEVAKREGWSVRTVVFGVAYRKLTRGHTEELYVKFNSRGAVYAATLGGLAFEGGDVANRVVDCLVNL